MSVGMQVFFSQETNLRFLNNGQVWGNVGRHVAHHLKMYPSSWVIRELCSEFRFFVTFSACHTAAMS